MNWKQFVLAVLSAAPNIIADIENDIGTFGHEAKTDAATQATLQADQVASQLDPNDSEQIAAATAVTAGLITALKTPPPQNAPAGS